MKVCAYNERRWVNLKFRLTNLVHLIQESRSDCVHLSNEYTKIVTPSARFLNQINKIREIELQIYPSSFVISTYLLLKTFFHPHQTRVRPAGFRATLRFCLF